MATRQQVPVAPGLFTWPSDDPQLIVAVTDYALSDALGGGGTPKHSRTSGQVEWIPAGAENRWTNTAATSARFIIIRFGTSR